MLTYISNATAASTTPNTRLFIRRSTLNLACFVAAGRKFSPCFPSDGDTDTLPSCERKSFSCDFSHVSKTLASNLRFEAKTGAAAKPHAR
jgi:hypothetical protein